MSLDFQSPDAEDRNAGVGATNSGKVPIRDINLGASTIVYYSDGTYDVFPNSKLPASSGGSSTSTNYSVQDPNALAQSAQQNNANIAEQQRQFNEKLWYDKARGDQQQQLSQELGRGGLDVSRGNLGVSQGQLALSQQKQAQDYYLRLSEVASNPRNFVQNYFLQRGQQPPGNASQFGNAGRMPSYAPSQGQPYAAAQQPQQAAPAAPAQQQTGSPYNPATDPNRGTRFEGLSGFNTDGTLRLAPNDPDAEGLMAKHPGQYRIGFAQGGVTPEPIVGRGVISGQQYMIGENGPEGVVPASYLPKFLQQRHGQMMGEMRGYSVGGQLGYDIDPYKQLPGGDPYTTPDTAARTPTGGDPYTTPDPYAPLGTPTSVDPSSGYSTNEMPGAPITTLPPTSTTGASLPDFSANTAPLGFHWENGVLVPDAGTDTRGKLPPPPPPLRQPIQLPQGNNTNTAGGQPSNTNTLTSGGTTPTGGTPTGGLMPRDVATPGTFGAPIGNRPQFLPGEDQGSVLSSLLAGGALPPFLSRLFGQQHGVDSVGTNKPQTYNLPADVPLVSKIAWTQMTPSEQQGLLSYASSYGVTPEDYLAAIESFSPQGGRAQSPLFGNSTYFNRQ